MSELSTSDVGRILPLLEITAEQAFNQIAKDLAKDPQTPEHDLPVGAVVLDRTGMLYLGQGVASDRRTGETTAHAEVNAIIDACTHHDENFTQSGIVVSTLESCNMCQSAINKSFGNKGLIAYVTSREEIEALGLVNPRSGTYQDRPVNQVKLTNPKLQEKGKILFSNVTRDPSTGLTIVNKAPILEAFGKINEEFRLRV